MNTLFNAQSIAESLIKINRMHEKYILVQFIMTVCNDTTPSCEELLEIDNSVSVYHRSIRILATELYNSLFFFLSGFSFTGTDDSQDSRGREGTIFYSTLPLPPAQEHSDIYLKLCM